MSLEHDEVQLQDDGSTSLNRGEVLRVNDRYSRHVEFFPLNEQLKISNARILLAGCGAGSTLADPLSKMGYGTGEQGLLVLADPDTVDMTNLNRQLFGERHVGANKAVALADVIAGSNSDVHTLSVTEGITHSNVDSLVGGSDAVCDMIDVGVPSLMIALHRAAQRHRVPIVTGYDLGEGTTSLIFDYRDPRNMTLEGYLGFEGFSLEEIEKMTNDPQVKLAISIQMLLGPVRERDQFEVQDPLQPSVFLSIDDAQSYYTSVPFSDENIALLRSRLPEEMSPVIDKLLRGELDYIPQIYSAASMLGIVHEKGIRRLLLNKPVVVVPERISTDLDSLISGRGRVKNALRAN